MSKGANHATLSSCGCCAGESPHASISNAPGETAIGYRLGDYGVFFQRLLNGIGAAEIPDGANRGARPLRGLTTRSPDDPTIALLDAWAVVADVLTFYQERIANEGYLRTATERRSVLELARQIGYELDPGVAASVYLQFTVQEIAAAAASAATPGSRSPATAGPGGSVYNFGVVDLPKGVQAQSSPRPGELPQPFETANDLHARVEWNALAPRLAWTADIGLYAGRLYLLASSAGFANRRIARLDPSELYLLNPQVHLRQFDGLIPAIEIASLYLQGTATNLKAGDRLLFIGANGSNTQAQSFVVHGVETQTTFNRTKVMLDVSVRSRPIFAESSLAIETPQLGRIPFNQQNVDAHIRDLTITESDLQAFLSLNGWGASALEQLVNNPTHAANTAVGVFAFRANAGFFGANAPKWLSLPDPSKSQRGDPYSHDWDTANDGVGRYVWTDSQGELYQHADVYLERQFPQATRGGYVLMEADGLPSQVFQITKATDAALADYGLSGKATGLSLNLPSPKTTSLQDLTLFPVRTAKAFLQAEPLAFADIPIEDPIVAGVTEIMLDRMTIGLEKGQAVALSGLRADAQTVAANEILILADVSHIGGYTRLQSQSPLQYSYLRQTLTISANVALATHGASVTEILGNGDASQTNQTFRLKRPPLTYVSAPTPSGSVSSLEIRVNDLEWKEASTLYGLTSKDERYVVRLADDGTPSVTFGAPAARLKTGAQNVRANYRTGVGLVGNVPAGTISMLMSRPPGLRAVNNPLAASGGADPQTLADARGNAPLTVLTLDRIVSLADYENFARSFAGIGKAKAVVLWSGEKRVVHITIAGADGGAVDPASPLYAQLARAINLAHDPVQQFMLGSHQPLTFNLTVAILVDRPRYLVDAVKAQTQAVLSAAFSFGNRAFAQPVTAAEILALVQAVPGVVAANIQQLYLSSEPLPPSQDEPPAVLSATVAYWSAGAIVPAQLLLINPVGLNVLEMAA